jgi:hypothetical protein
MRNNSVGTSLSYLFEQPSLKVCLIVAIQGTSFGVADGVGGWVTMGVDPAMFSQSLMYHAHKYSKEAWAGEPESDPTQDAQEPVEGWEQTPLQCLELAHDGVLRDRDVLCGMWYPSLSLFWFHLESRAVYYHCIFHISDSISLFNRLEYGLYSKS